MQMDGGLWENMHVEGGWLRSESHLPMVVCSLHVALCSFDVTSIVGRQPETPVVTAAFVSHGNAKTGEVHAEQGQHFGHRDST